MIDFTCPHCSRALQIDEKYLGQSGNCNHCGNRITITVAPPPIENSHDTVSIPSSVQGKPLADVLKLFPGFLSELNGGQLLKIHKLLSKDAFIHPSTANKHIPFITELDSARISELTIYQDEIEASDRPKKRIESMIQTRQKKLLREFRIQILHACGRYYSGHASYLIAKKREQQYKRWISSGDEEVSDSCAKNESIGWIPTDDYFPSGHLHAPSHVNGCRCTVTYRTNLPR